MTAGLIATVSVAVAPVIGLAVCFVAHVVVSRRAPALPRQHGLLVSVLVGAAAVAGLLGPSLADDLTQVPGLDAWAAVVAALAAYVLLAYGYAIGFFNIGESARRIRLLIELEGAGPRGLTLAELLAVYNARMIVEARLQRLLSGGQIVERSGRYYLQSRVMLGAAKALVLLKVLLLCRRTEAVEASP
jgi:hypothetical protein